MSAVATAPTAETQSGRGVIIISVMLATIMQAIDTTIANVAIPSMQGSLSATLDQVSWVLTSYIVASAIFMPPTGFFAARLGRKRVFLISVFGFTIASMLCGAATSLPEMVLFRLLQGVFGAALIPLSQAVLLDSFPPAKHGAAMALWGVGVMVGPIAGPTLGGWLTDAYSWRWVFYVNLPVGVLTFLGILWFVPETKRDFSRRFDALGFVLLSVAIGALQMMLDRGESQGWFTSIEVLIEAGLGCGAAYLFVVHTFTTDQPFLDPKMFADRNFVTGSLFMFLIGVILLASLALLPPFLQNLMGYPVLDTGFLLAPRGIGTMVSMVIVGRIIGKVDTRLMILVGLLLIVISLWEMTEFNANIGAGAIVWTGVIQGLGLGLVFVPLSTISFATLNPRYRTDGAGIFSLVRNIGSSIGVAAVVNYLATSTQANHQVLAEHINPFNPLLQSLPSMWDPTATTGLAALNNEVTRQAATLAYLNDFYFMMLVALVTLPLLFLLKTPGRAPAPAASAAHAPD